MTRLFDIYFRRERERERERERCHHKKNATRDKKKSNGVGIILDRGTLPTPFLLISIMYVCGTWYSCLWYIMYTHMYIRVLWYKINAIKNSKITRTQTQTNTQQKKTKKRRRRRRRRRRGQNGVDIYINTTSIHPSIHTTSLLYCINLYKSIYQYN